MRKLVLVAAVLGLTVSAHTARPDWPQYGHDPARTFRSTDQVPPPLSVAWMLQGGRVHAAVADADHLYVVLEPLGQAGVSWLLSLSLASGRPGWVLENAHGDFLGGRSGLALQGGHLYVCYAEGVSALDPRDGGVLWERKTEGVPVQVTADGANLYVAVTGRASRGGQVVCLDSSSGEERWRATHGESVACASAKAVYTETTHTLYQVDKQTGRASWSFYGATEVRFIDGLLYTNRGVLTEEGTRLREAEAPPHQGNALNEPLPTSVLPGVTELIRRPEGWVQTGGNGQLYSVVGARLVSLNEKSDAVRWRAGTSVSKIALGGRWIYASSGDSGGGRWRLSVIDSASGEQVWSYRPPMGFYPGVSYGAMAPVVTSGGVCAMGSREVYCLRSAHGSTQGGESEAASRGTISVDGRPYRATILVRYGVPFVPLRVIYRALGYRFSYSPRGGVLVVPTHPDPGYPRARYRLPLTAEQGRPAQDLFPYNWEWWTGYGAWSGSPWRRPAFRGGHVFVALDRVPLLKGIVVWRPRDETVLIITHGSLSVPEASAAGLSASVD